MTLGDKTMQDLNHVVNVAWLLLALVALASGAIWLWKRQKRNANRSQPQPLKFRK
jgi:uncharacterized iron-regulated membrane protein